MASIDRADPVIMGHLLAQHRELHDLLVEARAAFEQPSGAVARADAAARLGSLRQHLARHFSQEEQGGYMEESLTRMPRLSQAVRNVLAEHPALLGELDRLLERLAARDSGEEGWRQAGRAFEAFASHLLAHERNENAVVQEGYNEDLGLVD
ncbi:MAG: hemerythrin domain-containing protein [Planctomycetota bacterium]